MFVSTLRPILYICMITCCVPQAAMATVYTLYNDTETVIGDLSSTYSTEEDTLLDIARANGLGFQDIKLFNPGIDTWLPGSGTEIQLPSKYILPEGPREGLVLNIPEMRMYHYFKAKDGLFSVETYPLGVGREGWSTPYMKTKIIEKKKDPSWTPPKSILKEHAEAGDPLPAVVKPGPDNPLGAYAMRLSRRQYLIHGTNKPFGIGLRVSHGCIRLYPEDIEYLFQKVKVGTKVEIVNQPYKIGERDGILYLEAHPFLEEDAAEFDNNLTPVVNLILSQTDKGQYDIDWDKVRYAVRNPNGIPVPIGIGRLIPDDAELAMADNGLIEKQIDASDSDIQVNDVVPETSEQIPDITSRAIQFQENKLELRLDMILSE